jgi:formylglycine-generating enzyme required for sulfatase activity/dienelactone hydrolase
VSGEALGHFEITDKLAEGGMGVLYRARDTRLGRTVAIKLLRPEVVADPERTQRFVQEARAASALSHPNIVTIHDIGEDRRRGTWIAMECLDGESLRQRLERGRLAVEEALRIALEVARGLAAAHAAGIVHRDVKPANVMITNSGLVKVLDFGLAKLVASDGTAEDSRAPTLSSPPFTRLGVLLGTPAYMSPEQAEGRPVDARSDVFSFGALLYEMLAGRRPFEGASELSLLSAILRDLPPRLRSLRPEVDPRVEKLIDRCLAKHPAARPPSAQALLPELEACLAREPRGPAAGFRRRPAWMAGLVVLLAALAGLGAWSWRRGTRERWARREALPEIQRLIDADRITPAFRLAEEVRSVLAGDPEFEAVWLDLATPTSVSSEPAGAEVSVKPYSEPDVEWRPLGSTPLERVDLPNVYSRFRIEKPGFEAVEVAFPPPTMSRQSPFRLLPRGQAPPGMVRVPGGPFQYRGAPAVDLPGFWLDRYEVTNRRFAEFVKGGGYERRELWKHAIARRGESLRFEEAMALFRDRTGRPGPSSWELGSYPEGEAEFPVSGVSWYEAAAFAEFEGKSLPTLHHWYRAADLSRFSDVLRYSNFGDRGPRAVGQEPSLTGLGNYDMAGNVREWVWNADGDRRYTLGGAWSDPTYLYTGPDALDPMDRSPILGVRMARYDGPPPEAALRPIDNVLRDLSRAEPAGDDAFRIYRRLFDYDATAVDAKVEAVDERSEHWRVEKVSFAAAYGGERVPARLFLPKNAAPPFQAVVYFPPASALHLPSIDRVGGRDFAFVVRSGRAVLFPVYQQTYERRRPGPRGPNYLREVTTQRALDVRRAIDYLESRAEVDRERIAFYGLSMGADEGAIVGAVEPRLRTLILVATGLDDGMPPEADALNFAPRVRVPVLMINGRYDFLAPLETSQKPLFRLLGSPEKDKKHVVLDSGHVPPWPDVVRQTLDWLDRYLGPVARAAVGP